MHHRERVKSKEVRGKNNSLGFTVVELMLAMTFLTFMLLFCVVATTQILKTYSKGITIRQMNQAGRTMSEEVVRTARTAQSGRIVFNKNAGRLCLGDTAYVWNDTTPSMSGGSSTNRLNGEQLNVIRLDDPAQNACNNLSDKDFATGAPDNAVRVTSNQIRVLNFDAEPNDSLIRFNFILGSYSPTDNTLTPQFIGGKWECSKDTGGNFCAFAEFSTVAYLLNE